LTLGDYSILDEVKIWNEALSQAEVVADKENLVPVDPRIRLTGLWGQIKSTE
jgi:hypothetical protein